MAFEQQVGQGGGAAGRGDRRPDGDDDGGEQFDASWDRGDPLEFRLGVGMVIQGWDEGIAGMRVGGRRRITIPPAMGYGKRGFPPVIKSDETLVFVVDLVGVR